LNFQIEIVYYNYDMKLSKKGENMKAKYILLLSITMSSTIQPAGDDHGLYGSPERPFGRSNAVDPDYAPADDSEGRSFDRSNAVNPYSRHSIQLKLNDLYEEATKIDPNLIEIAVQIAHQEISSDALMGRAFISQAINYKKPLKNDRLRQIKSDINEYEGYLDILDNTEVEEDDTEERSFGRSNAVDPDYAE
jgi:hypothetical protein